MIKIAINRCFGVFGLSKLAYEELGLKWDGHGYKYNSSDKRTDPDLIVCIEKLGKDLASGPLSSVEVVEVPDDVFWEITEYDGMECVEEIHPEWC